MLYYLGTQERATKYRGVEQMVARRLITRRSQVQILSPQPNLLPLLIQYQQR